MFGFEIIVVPLLLVWYVFVYVADILSKICLWISTRIGSGLLFFINFIKNSL